MPRFQTSNSVANRPSRLALMLLAIIMVAGTVSAQQPKPSGKASQEKDATAGSNTPGETAATDATTAETSASDESTAVESQNEAVKLPPPPPKRGPEIPFEMQRYQIELPIVFQPSVKLGPSVRRSIVDELRVLIDRSVGPMWDLKITHPDWITPRNRTGLDRITSEQLKKRAVVLRFVQVVREQLSEHTEGSFPVEAPEPPSEKILAEVHKLLSITDDAILEPAISEFVRKVASGHSAAEAKSATVGEVIFLYLSPPPIKIDKVLPVSVEVHGGSYVVSAREWDRESELMTSVRTRTTIDRRTIAPQILRLLSEVFRPVAQIDEAAPQTARIRYKAGEYPPGDPAFAQAVKNAMYIPFFRYLDRNKVVQKIQFLPWSYITAREVERIRANCDFATGVKTPLGSFRRRRMELRALALKPHTEKTTLTLVPKRLRARPLVGYLVAVYNELPPPPPKPGEEPEEDAPEREKPDIYRSNRFGNVTIPVDPDKPLQWVFIRSGSALLAKFPLVAGAETQMTVECPDDTIRLDVEGQIVLLQSRLVDAIAKQAMVKAMINNRAKKSEWKKVDESLNELDELPTIESFESMVSEIQYPALKKAQERNDRISQSRIKKLGQSVLKVARLHLDQQKLDEFREDIIEQRRIDEPNYGRNKRAAPGQR